MHEIKHNHRWLNLWYHYDPDQPRFYRILILLAMVTIMVFAQALTYSISEGNDGTCERLSNEEEQDELIQ